MTHCLSCISHILECLGPDVPSGLDCADTDFHHHGTFYWAYLNCYKKMLKTRTLLMKTNTLIIWKALVCLSPTSTRESWVGCHPLRGVCVSSSWQSPAPSVLRLHFTYTVTSQAWFPRVFRIEECTVRLPQFLFNRPASHVSDQVQLESHVTANLVH